MKHNFREHHLFQILSQYESQSLPLDLFLRNYFRQHTAVGSKDRKFIAEAVYGMIRWRGLLDHLCDKPFTWEKRLERYVGFDPLTLQADQTIPQHVRVSFPRALFDLLCQSLGEEKAIAFCLASNTAAPTTVRVNTLKCSREALLQKWGDQVSVAPTEHSAWGITFKQKVNFFALPEFKEGCFEVQDEASQLVANLLPVQPGNLILDYCAGAGGKALAIAPKMQHKGQLYLHDIRHHALLEAKKRLKRAGVQNAQLLPFDAEHKHALKHKMDSVMIDAPCSGTGTYRRNPDMKWKFSTDSLANLVLEQQQIFAEGLAYLKSGGHILYATCSVLPQENERQAAFFEQKYSLERVAPSFESMPTQGGMDGFYGVVFRKS